MFTDTHCHLLKEYYDDIDVVISNAKHKGINRFFNSSYDENSIKEVLESITKYSNVYGVIGLHPSEAMNNNENALILLKESLNINRVIAIGEIGLDYHYGKDSMNQQKELFRTQLKIAESNNLPVVIHSRDATEDTINILKDYKVKGVIHSFSGSIETAKIYIKMGFKLGINGVVTFNNSHLIEVIKCITPSDIILETDCPYLTPTPYRGTINSPEHIIDIVDYLVKNIPISQEQLSYCTEANIKHLFDI